MKAQLPVFVVLFILCGLFASLSPYFLTVENLFNILQASTTICLLAIAATFVLASAGIDLSIGSIMAVSGMASVIITQHYSLPWFVLPVLCLAVGLVSGLINGWLIGFVNLPAFIVTLGTLSMFRGLALVMSEGRSIYGLNAELLEIGQGGFGLLPYTVLTVVVTGMIAYLILHHTRFGIHTLAVGDNETAAYISGINLKNHKLWLYGLSGLLAGLAGLLFLTRLNAADPNAGFMSELTAITAAIIGGTSLFGGRASVIGTIAGALLMTVLQNGLTLLNVPSYYQQIAIGGTLIIAVCINRKITCCSN